MLCVLRLWGLLCTAGGLCWAPVCPPPCPARAGPSSLLADLPAESEVALVFGAGAPERVGPAGSARAGGTGGLWDESGTQTGLCPADTRRGAVLAPLGPGWRGLGVPRSPRLGLQSRGSSPGVWFCCCFPPRLYEDLPHLYFSESKSQTSHTPNISSSLWLI